jgi:hypothetical protein
MCRRGSGAASKQYTGHRRVVQEQAFSRNETELMILVTPQIVERGVVDAQPNAGIELE